MEFPTQFTNYILVALVVVLSLVPLFSVPSTIKIINVYRKDPARPRNGILRAMSITTSIVTAASIMFLLLTIPFLFDRLNGVPLEADFGSVMLTALLIGTGMTPYLKWRALDQLNGHAPRAGQTETQNQREDRQFGEERRKLEAEHSADRENLRTLTGEDRGISNSPNA